ncbi:MAG: hypothetical protein MZV63_56800 [Marinilabiliales bacterium]|nr:hypothetical protein [Marinilabiliales bacterium]
MTTAILTAKNIIIATGSYPRPLPFKVHDKKILNLENFFSMKEIPQKLLVVGEGPVVSRGITAAGTDRQGCHPGENG